MGADMVVVGTVAFSTGTGVELVVAANGTGISILLVSIIDCWFELDNVALGIDTASAKEDVDVLARGTGCCCCCCCFGSVTGTCSGFKGTTDIAGVGPDTAAAGVDVDVIFSEIAVVVVVAEDDGTGGGTTGADLTGSKTGTVAGAVAGTVTDFLVDGGALIVVEGSDGCGGSGVSFFMKG
jgi:hypothetical protein